MTAGRLVLKCRASGEQIPLEEIRQHGYDFIIARSFTVTPYFLPFKAGEQPPVCPPGAKPDEVAEWFDELIGRVIADCLQKPSKQ